MCLAVPGKIININGGRARVDIEGVIHDANITLLPNAEAGDYVIVHAGFAIEKYDKEDAIETLKLLKKAEDAEWMRILDC